MKESLIKTPKEYKGYDGSLIIYSDGSRYIKLPNGQIVKESTYDVQNQRK